MNKNLTNKLAKHLKSKYSPYAKLCLCIVIVLTAVTKQSLSQENVLISQKTGYGFGFVDAPEAALEIRSTTKGLLIPRLASTTISFIPNPAQGLLVFNTDDNLFYFFSTSGNQWKSLLLGTSTLTPSAQTTASPGGVALNETVDNPDGSAMLDIQSGTQGILIPRLSSAEIRNLTNTPEGLLVFNKDVEEFSVYVNTSFGWQNLAKGTETIELFQCGSSFIDPRNNMEYETVQLGANCWMANNLNIGTRIVNTEEPADNGIIEKYCYNNQESSCDTYGGMYTWNEVMQYSEVESSQGLCPDGWYIPDLYEWLGLKYYFVQQGHLNNEGIVMKSTSGWYQNGNGTDDYNFTALPAGRRHYTTQFLELSQWANFWTSSKVTSGTAHYIANIYNKDEWFRSYRSRSCGISVRCIKKQ